MWRRIVEDATGSDRRHRRSQTPASVPAADRTLASASPTVKRPVSRSRSVSMVPWDVAMDGKCHYLVCFSCFRLICSPTRTVLLAQRGYRNAGCPGDSMQTSPACADVIACVFAVSVHLHPCARLRGAHGHMCAIVHAKRGRPCESHLRLSLHMRRMFLTCACQSQFLD